MGKLIIHGADFSSSAVQGIVPESFSKISFFGNVNKKGSISSSESRLTFVATGNIEHSDYSYDSNLNISIPKLKENAKRLFVSISDKYSFNVYVLKNDFTIVYTSGWYKQTNEVCEIDLASLDNPKSFVITIAKGVPTDNNIITESDIVDSEIEYYYE